MYNLTTAFWLKNIAKKSRLGELSGNQNVAYFIIQAVYSGAINNFVNDDSNFEFANYYILHSDQFIK